MKVDEKYIKAFVERRNYDVRKSGNARFTDQKCIPDVVCAVAECIIEYVREDLSTTFSKDDIWHSQYANDLLAECFSKPDTENETTTSEYDKFFAQPMKMLAAAGILTEAKVNGVNIYRIVERDILSFISSREKNALVFLDVYLTKVMKDSGCMPNFEEFFNKQDKNSLYALRDKLTVLYRDYTPVRGSYEPPRIYNKIINIMAIVR